jgi:hypothetical protein
MTLLSLGYRFCCAARKEALYTCFLMSVKKTYKVNEYHKTLTVAADWSYTAHVIDRELNG